MSHTDVYQCVANATLLAQECRLVFHYQVTADPLGGSTAAQLATFVIGNVLPAILPFASDQLEFGQVETFNYDNTADFDVQDSGGLTGAVTGDCNPPFVAFGFELVRATRECHNGSKRVPGVPAASITNGVVNSGVLPDLATFATAYGATQSGGGIDYSPVIFRKPSPAIPAGVAFVTNGAIYKRITSQGSRKFGRGI